MKALLYKEFKLAWHPLCYVFLGLFSLLILIPNYPAFVGIMLVPIVYTLLFLGANKGKQTNDLYYTINLPVKKSNIVISRYISMLVMQLSVLLLTGALAPLAQLIRDSLHLTNNMGFDLNYIGNVIAFGLVSYAIIDALFLIMFYKKGRSILAPSLIGMFAVAIVMVVFTIVLPIVIPAYKSFFQQAIWIQFVSIAIGLVIYAIAHYFSLKIAIKEIKKIEF